MFHSGCESHAHPSARNHDFSMPHGMFVASSEWVGCHPADQQQQEGGGMDGRLAAEGNCGLGSSAESGRGRVPVSLLDPGCCAVQEGELTRDTDSMIL